MPIAPALVHHGFYDINGRPETNQPPGLWAFLALLCLFGGCTYATFLRSMAVFEILGLLVVYELLRRETTRLVAALICLLLISSEVFFSVATRFVYPSYPYSYTSMTALFVARRFDQAPRRASGIFWGTFLTALIVASLIFVPSGIALLIAILATVIVFFFAITSLASST